MFQVRRDVCQSGQLAKLAMGQRGEVNWRPGAWGNTRRRDNGVSSAKGVSFCMEKAVSRTCCAIAGAKAVHQMNDQSHPQSGFPLLWGGKDSSLWSGCALGSALIPAHGLPGSWADNCDSRD